MFEHRTATRLYYRVSMFLILTMVGLLASHSLLFADPLVVTDSVYGTVKDEAGNDLSVVPTVRFVNHAGTLTKEVSATGGQYVVYFAPSERGVWWVDVRPDKIVPNYMQSVAEAIDNTFDPSIQLNLVSYNADTTVYIRVTENGADPANPYHLKISHAADGVFALGTTGTGVNNIAAIGVTKQLPLNWFATFVGNDSLYPIPANFLLEGGEAHPVLPGDTTTLNWINAISVSDTLFVDPGDPLPNWDSTFIGICVIDSCIAGTIDINGAFTVYSDSGDISLSAYHADYLVTPAYRNFHLSSDTSGNLGFTLNHAHCRVYGNLTNVTLPLDAPAFITAITVDSLYSIYRPVEMMTGAYTLPLCDGDWIITPPDIAGGTTPPAAELTILESPDTVRLQDFNYSILADADDETGTGTPDGYQVRQNFPNPFNLSTVIAFSLPKAAHVQIEIMNCLGQKVATVADRQFASGYHEIGWDGADNSGKTLPSGVYMYRIEVGSYSTIKKMLLLK